MDYLFPISVGMMNQSDTAGDTPNPHSNEGVTQKTTSSRKRRKASSSISSHLCLRCGKMIKLDIYEDHILKHKLEEEILKNPTASPNCDSLHCDVCGKLFHERQKDYDRHVFIHKLEEVTVQLPDSSTLASLVEDLVIKIMEEFVNKQNDTLWQFVFVLKKSVGTSEWIQFVRAISELLLDSFGSSTKILPSNRYEDFLKAMNRFFQDDKKVAKLKKSILLCTPAKDYDLKTPEKVLFRLCFRLGEEMQKFIISEMKKLELSFSAKPIVLPDEEKKSLKLHWRRILLMYYGKGSNVKSPVWEKRCACIRSRFIVSQSMDNLTSADILKKSYWQPDVNGSCILQLSNQFLDFCFSVDFIIRSNFPESSEIVLDLILDSVVGRVSTMDKWQTLTDLFMAEVDSLIFMRDMVCILTNLFSRLHCKRLVQTEPGQRHSRSPLKENN